MCVWIATFLDWQFCLFSSSTHHNQACKIEQQRKCSVHQLCEEQLPQLALPHVNICDNMTIGHTPWPAEATPPCSQVFKEKRTWHTCPDCCRQANLQCCGHTRCNSSRNRPTAIHTTMPKTFSRNSQTIVWFITWNG